ncbi:MAG TPA: glycosyltransferase family 39 protein [Bacteroidales bacterium]|nr:glycosyltransferase family 39 protein [Bacteroidales bacterium]
MTGNRKTFIRPSINIFGNIQPGYILWLLPLVASGLYINLGLLPLKGDEAIRAEVALEMMLSGNYITPTLTGELYLNKPPLYNWILIGFFRLFQNNSEFMVRFPTTLFLLLYCIIIFYWVRKELGKQIALMSSLAFFTCGRILFWDSYLGLIDIFFSGLTFLNFMLIWHLYRKRKFFRLFVISYLLTAFCFLLKGLPALVFQGFALLVIFLQHKNYKGLISWKHLTGILILLFLTGTYYFLYSIQNPGYVDDALMRLVTESTHKSAIGSTIQKTILHFFTFPLEVIQHFLPWILLTPFLFYRKIFNRILKTPFIRYCFLIFMANIVIYWLSPTTYPRYLLMLMPLLFLVCLYSARYHIMLKTLQFYIVQGILVVFVTGLIFSSTLLPALFRQSLEVDHFWLKLLAVVLISITAVVWKRKSPKAGLLFFTAIVLLISRLSFDLFLMPYRESHDLLSQCRKDAIELADKTKGQPLFYMTDTITMHNVYYITRERDEILTFNGNPAAGPWFIVDDTLKAGAAFKKEIAMKVPYQNKTFYAGKFSEPGP